MKDSSGTHHHLRHTQLVLRSAIASRLLLVTLIILWRSLLRPYDTSASINPSCLSSSSAAAEPPILFPRAAAAIEDSIVWDGVYFVRIAQCGYEYEQSFAFFPLLPICISFLSRTVFAPLVPLFGLRAVLALSGYMLNNIAFVLAALYLYRVSIIILKDSETALRASIIFCFNPASIFYSSIYSESLYALLSIGGLYHLLSDANICATLFLALSGAVRSNGMLNAGYICFQTMHRAYDIAFNGQRTFFAVLVLITGALRCLVVFVPFITFQAYGYYNICVGRSLDEMRPWCKARLPSLYNYIQSHYWGVGFLNYFQLKQLPNFLLACPILSLSLCSIIHYIKRDPEVFLSLGFCLSPANRSSGSSGSLLASGADGRSKSAYNLEKASSKLLQDQSIRQRKQHSEIKNPDPFRLDKEEAGNSGYLSVVLLPFVVHTGFMAATAFFVMHVQVSTRFLSANLPLYWFASYIMVSPGIHKIWGYLIWTYCAAYILLGSLLFSNFYPFT